MFCFDMILYITMAHTGAQLKILNKVISGAYDMKIQNKSDLKKFKLLMKRCIEHHDFLLRYIKSIDKEYAGPLASFFMSMFMGNVVESYRFTTSNDIVATIRSLLYVTTGILVIFFVCYFIPAQFIQDEANKISRSIYLTKWYEHSLNAKPVVMIIARAYRPCRIVPCGIWELNLETGLMVIRATISYAMFLRTL
ncbi:unnamed protein product [Acanthoscelides obtectus]|uniref:Uncharacterized protein n=1 Tax=Acanthoscelides obtectus TaxID=200917 RepID=A0A9P0Q7N5_ACAOB|nr:unnamed protein product [Acanthoscelides obtectus]CAK1623165.1 hypothetical protein AOBTE_LOCUS1848 [Acanthoscelides obtectus]